MSDAASRVQTRHGELSLEEIAEALPGTADVMAAASRAYASAWFAAHGGNWDLAAYCLRRVRSLQRGLAVIRPKYARQLQEFDREALAPLVTAVEARDLGGFERAFDHGVERANHYHAETGKSYIRWVRPKEPPESLDFGPGPEGSGPAGLERGAHDHPDRAFGPPGAPGSGQRSETEWVRKPFPGPPISSEGR